MLNLKWVTSGSNSTFGSTYTDACDCHTTIGSASVGKMTRHLRNVTPSPTTDVSPLTIRNDTWHQVRRFNFKCSRFTIKVCVFHKLPSWPFASKTSHCINRGIHSSFITHFRPNSLNSLACSRVFFIIFIYFITSATPPSYTHKPHRNGRFKRIKPPSPERFLLEEI